MTNLTTWQDFNEGTGQGTSGSAASTWVKVLARGREWSAIMKTKWLIIGMFVFGVLAGQEARAFYNPSTGCWLKRDAINEAGFNVLIRNRSAFNRQEEKNLYNFVGNDAANFCDSDGRAVGYGLGALLAAAYVCAKPQYDVAFERYPDFGDKFKHCWVSCRISKTCGGYIAELAGIAKETRDQAIALYCESHPDSEICQGGHGDFWDSLGDLAANQRCIGWETILDLPGFPPVFAWTGALCRKSCEDCCRAKVGYKAGEP